MMKMLRYFGLMVFVVCIAAFASGCGGGGGGGSATTPEEPPVVVPEPDPETDAERIAAAIGTVADILIDAQEEAQTASSTAAEIGLHLDVTEDQLASAGIQNRNALAALNTIVSAVARANSATTAAQAEAAVITAMTAYDALVAAQSSLVAILSEVESPTTPTPPVQQPTDDIQFTGGSPLIQHVRNNSIINEAVLSNLAPADLEVGPTSATNGASFPVDTGTGSTAMRGELSVTARSLSSVARGTTALPSISTLGSGFDMKGESGGTTTYVNAYTDISKATNVRVKTEVDGDSVTSGNQPTFEIQPMSDADYLLLGIWLTVPSTDTSMAKMGAFAYGSRNLASISDLPKYDPNDPDLEQAELDASTDSAVPFGITDFVAANQDLSATYTGKVTGAYLVGGKAGQLEASISLTADFRNLGTTGEADIGGTISNLMAGDQSIEGYIDLVKKTGHTDLTTAITDGVASGVVANNPYSGTWNGQFFEPRYRRTTEQENAGDDTNPRNLTKYVYTPEAPGTFAGAFQVRKSGVADAGIIGAFGAKR